MQFLDFLIELLTYGSALILAISFARYAWQRANAASNAVLSEDQLGSQLEQRLDAEGRDVNELPGLWSCSDVIVPFKRPQRDYSDLALIRLAKSLANQDKYDRKALKWSFSRKLSKTTRQELLKLAACTASAS